VHLTLGLPAAIISGVAGVSAFSKFTNHDVWAGVLALIAAGLGAANAFLDPAERTSTHQNFGNDYNSLRNRARLSSSVDSHGLSDSELAAQTKELSGERDSLNKKAPQIPRRAFKRARKGIEQGEASYKTDVND
jgi:hypothetical protein